MNIFNRLFSHKGSKSRDVAKNRLQLVLVQDRVDLPPEKMDQLKGDLIRVVSRYVEIEKDGIDIILANSQNRQSRLTVDIPVTGVRQR